MRRIIPLVLLIGASCAIAESPVLEPTESPLLDPTTVATTAIEATVRVDPEPGGKKFQGVWLELDADQRLLVAYNKRAIWSQFEGHRVRVTGEHYQPEGQSIGADHYRIHTLEVVNTEDMASFVRVGPLKDFEGELTVSSGEPGSKMEGESWSVFSSGNRGFQLANPSALDGASGALTLSAREVERSPFAAHMGGPMLWIESVKPK